MVICDGSPGLTRNPLGEGKEERMIVSQGTSCTGAWSSETTLQRATESSVDPESSLGGAEGDLRVRVYLCVCFIGLCDYMNVCTMHKLPGIPPCFHDF